MNKRVAIGVALVIALVAGTIVLLASGGPVEPGDTPVSAPDAESQGDVVVAEGPAPPTDTALADVLEADVRRRGDSLVFRARMATDIPQRVKGGGMSWRWDVYEGGAGTWILSANLDIGPNATLTSTQSNYGSGTFDDTLPGKLSIEGDTLSITLTPTKLEDWPDDFEWVLGTSLDGAQGNPHSALATDTSPNEGRGTIEG